MKEEEFSKILGSIVDTKFSEQEMDVLMGCYSVEDVKLNFLDRFRERVVEQYPGLTSEKFGCHDSEEMDLHLSAALLSVAQRCREYMVTGNEALLAKKSGPGLIEAESSIEGVITIGIKRANQLRKELSLPLLSEKEEVELAEGIKFGFKSGFLTASSWIQETKDPELTGLICKQWL